MMPGSVCQGLVFSSLGRSQCESAFAFAGPASVRRRSFNAQHERKCVPIHTSRSALLQTAPRRYGFALRQGKRRFLLPA